MRDQINVYVQLEHVTKKKPQLCCISLVYNCIVLFKHIGVMVHCKELKSVF